MCPAKCQRRTLFIGELTPDTRTWYNNYKQEASKNKNKIKLNEAKEEVKG